MKKLLSIFLLLLFSATANAHVFFKEECQGIAQLAGDIAFSRDHGIELAKVLETLDRKGHASISDPDSWVKDEDDIAGIKKMAETIYAHKEVTPDDAFNAITTSCLASALDHKRET